ncbi:MAG: hypothetical protein RLZZ387_2959 [Chloroflexota bacterium]|jgi:hypothetical protein
MSLSPQLALLALTAQARGHPAQHTQLHRHARALETWDGMAELAEEHGLAPLLSAHLTEAGIAPPPHERDELLGFVLQHANAARVRTRALAEILARFHAAGVEALALKGAALSFLVYPRPALRPMRDIDLLVRASDAPRAYALLGELGFRISDHPFALAPGHHHLDSLHRRDEGFSVCVELHHALDLNERGRPHRTFDELATGAQRFTVDGMPAAAVSRELMLWHVFRHALCMPAYTEQVRLIWLADMVSLAEAWVDDMDWELVRQRYPAALQAFALLNMITPLSPRLCARLQLGDARPLTSAGLFFEGWPRARAIDVLRRGIVPAATTTFFPPPWWLHLVYGRPLTISGRVMAWADHERAIWTHAADYGVGRLARRVLRRLRRAW